jgi:DNA-binding GntR family transcriptional regulator
MAKPPVKAQQLADLLAQRIRAGELSAGEWLPSERQIAETHEVSRGTARQAIQILTELGLVESVPGSGSQVKALAEATQASVDASAVHGALEAIHQELRQISQRLESIEGHVGSGGRAGR